MISPWRPELLDGPENGGASGSEAPGAAFHRLLAVARKGQAAPRMEPKEVTARVIAQAIPGGYVPGYVVLSSSG